MTTRSEDSIVQSAVSESLLLRTELGLEIRVETALSIVTADGHTLATNVEPADLMPELTARLIRPIVDLQWSTEGELLIELTDGVRVVVMPDANYEAWTVAQVDGSLTVALPGGEIASFGQVGANYRIQAAV